MYIVFGFLVCLRSSFLRKSGRTRVWARGSEPQAEDHHQTNGPGPAWLGPEQEAASNSHSRKSWRGSVGHAARGKQAGGGQSRARPLRAHGTEAWPWPCLLLWAGICKVVVFQALPLIALLFSPHLQHFWMTVNSLIFAPSAAHSESKVAVNINQIFN